MSETLEALRQQLVQSLAPGEMEILTACAASAITGLTFRHAKSGAQFGADATAEGIKVEVKAYLHKPPPDINLLGKLLQAAIDGLNPPDIWVLATTQPCASQTVDGLRTASRRLGIQVVVLDWQPGPLPALLALLAAAREATLQWIWEHRPELHDVVRAGLQQISEDSKDFPAVLATLKASLTPIVASYVATRKAMAESYRRAFAERSQAMILFGQALTPLAARGYIDRLAVFDRLDEQLQDEFRNEPLVVLGDEGVGKTWVVASYWYRRARDALFVLIPSRLALRHAREGARALLEAAFRAALRQTDERAPQWSLDLWRHRPESTRRLLIVLDGLNEQPSVPWPALIREVQAIITQIGGQLVLTCRPRFWHRELEARFAGEEFRSERVEGFEDEEFAEAMRRSGHNPERFPPPCAGICAIRESSRSRLDCCTPSNLREGPLPGSGFVGSIGSTAARKRTISYSAMRRFVSCSSDTLILLGPKYKEIRGARGGCAGRNCL